MTENEIIKALEYCATFTDGDCSECQYQNGACRAELIKDAFELAKSQKEEIAEKDEIIKAQADKIFLYEKVLKDKKAEIERLQKLNNELHKNIRENATNELHVMLGEVRFIEAEAYKEFAERLKTYCAVDRGFAVMPDDVIDNLVAEMTEQKNEGEE